MALLTCQLRFGLNEITDNSGVSSASRTTTSTSGRTFTLAEIREMSPVHPQDGRRPNFAVYLVCFRRLALLCHDSESPLHITCMPPAFGTFLNRLAGTASAIGPRCSAFDGI